MSAAPVWRRALHMCSEVCTRHILSARRHACVSSRLPIIAHSTGQTGSSKNCQGKRTVLKAFRSARYCGQDGAGKGLGRACRISWVHCHRKTERREQAGAFAGGASGVQSYLGPGGTDSIAYQLSFKASRSSGIYGASTTVMPASVESPVALYLGRFAEV